jgi:predicted Zn-dependent peptidase
MLEELARVATELPPETELERARNYAAGLVAVRRQRAAAWAAEILEAHVHGTLENLAEVPDRLRAVTGQEMAAAAHAIFRAERAAAYVVRGAGSSR